MKVILLHKFKHSYEKKTHNSKKKSAKQEYVSAKCFIISWDT